MNVFRPTLPNIGLCMEEQIPAPLQSMFRSPIQYGILPGAPAASSKYVSVLISLTYVYIHTSTEMIDALTACTRRHVHVFFQLSFAPKNKFCYPQDTSHGELTNYDSAYIGMCT